MWLLPLAMAAPHTFSAAESRLSFAAEASLHSFEGKAASFFGSFDPDSQTGSLEVAAASLSTGLGPRDERLRLWCLETERYPTIRFLVVQMEGNLPDPGEGSGSLTLSGDLSIRDQTRRVSVPLSWSREEDALRLRGQLPLNWAEFGIPDPGLLISTLQPDIQLNFDLLARPEP
jgi:polyisoprenoid-binding protein YceI